MRIVDRKTFLSLPAGTLYAKVPPLPMLDFGPLEIKDDTVANTDWYAQRLIGDFVDNQDCGDWADTFTALHDGGEAKPDFDIICRDGLFDADQLFAVYDHDDTVRLIERLQRALVEASPPELRA